MVENKKVGDLISDSWNIVELGELITSITNGVTYDPESSTGFPITRIETIAEGTINPEKVGLTPYTPSLEKFKLKKGEILYSHINSVAHIGKTAYCENDYEILHGMNLLKIKPKDSIDGKFLYYILNSKFGRRQAYSAAKRAVNQASLSTTEIRKFKFPIPPLPEQKAISYILTLMDIIIQKNNHLIVIKELQKKWMMQNLLTGKKRFRSFEKEKWIETSLEDLFKRVTRKNSEQNTNVVTISAQRGFVKQTDFFSKTIASDIIDNYFLVEKGEFCYNKSYSNGYPWGATKRLKDFDKAVVTTLYICFGLKKPKTDSGDFFEQYFEANLLDRGLTKIAHEGGRAHGLLNVTPSDFFSLKILIPFPKEQIAIAQLLKVADKEIQILKAKTDNLRTQKKGLMQQLLSGKKRLI
jgi:type I restriction enzyme, S subunit